MQFDALLFDTLTPARLTIEAGQIAAIATRARTRGDDQLPVVAPGFVDLQVNGLLGHEFSSPELTVDQVAAIGQAIYAHGVTRFLPTLTTQSFDVLAHGMRTVARACEERPEIARQMVGIHLEGPYISQEDGPRGAHPLAHCRPPCWDEFARLQTAAMGRIRLLTLSPEYEGAIPLIRRCVDSGVTVAIGHTAATGAQIRAAVDAGARLSTHLGNGAHRALRRHPNYLWDQLAEDRLTASLIVDGHHLPPEVVRVFVRAKGPERIVLVSDLSGLAGLPPGRYTSMDGELEILADGRLVIAGQDQLLAGASRPIGAGIAGVMQMAGVDLPTAIAMATSQPAALVGLPVQGLATGEPADLALFRLPNATVAAPGLPIAATIAAGHCVFGAVGS
ncbi:MAG: amidohydrolase family protein [Pirellulales bacterium]|nr:amidohydrolase family protein [Pirellulales bacterium]